MVEEIATLLNFLNTIDPKPKGYIIPTRGTKPTAFTTKNIKNIKNLKAAMKLEIETTTGEPFTIEAMFNFLKGRNKQNDE